MGFDVIPVGVWATIAASAAGGLVGGSMTDARDNVGASLLIGAIIGLSTATVLRYLNVYSPFDIEGFPILWGALAGLIGAWVVSKTTS
jgi:hypothetical protein